MDERLVYVSRAAPGLSSADAFDIVRVAHNRNARDGLTGALLFADGHFVQALEGPALPLRRRFEVIRHDPRHTDLSVRGHGPAPVLRFPQHWMALHLDGALAADIRRRHAYTPGLPPEPFDADRLLALLIDCCRHQVEADTPG